MTATKAPDEFIEELWTYANEVPMGAHPWFRGIIEHRWAREQIILDEVQHYLRVRTNVVHWGYVMVNAARANQTDLLSVVMENFLEEAGGERSHADIIFQLLEEAGLNREEADNAHEQNKCVTLRRISPARKRGPVWPSRIPRTRPASGTIW